MRLTLTIAAVLIGTAGQATAQDGAATPSSGAPGTTQPKPKSGDGSGVGVRIDLKQLVKGVAKAVAPKPPPPAPPPAEASGAAPAPPPPAVVESKASVAIAPAATPVAAPAAVPAAIPRAIPVPEPSRPRTRKVAGAPKAVTPPAVPPPPKVVADLPANPVIVATTAPEPAAPPPVQAAPPPQSPAPSEPARLTVVRIPGWPLIFVLALLALGAAAFGGRLFNRRRAIARTRSLLRVEPRLDLAAGRCTVRMATAAAHG